MPTEGSMKTLFLLCLLLLGSMDVSAQDTFSKIRDFKANSQYNISLDTEAKVEFVCDIIPGSPVGDVKLQSPGGRAKPFETMYIIPSNGSVIFRETRNLSCGDGGTYKCLVFPQRTHRSKSTHQDVFINITCPVNFHERTSKTIWVQSEKPEISIPFAGLPDPSDVKLYKVEGDEPKPISMTFKIKRDETKDKGDISMAIQEEDPAGIAGNYVLLASNAVQKGVPAELAFEVVKQPEKTEIVDFRVTVKEWKDVEFVCKVMPGWKSGGKVEFQLPNGKKETLDVINIYYVSSMVYSRKIRYLGCAVGGTFKCLISPEGIDQANNTHKDVFVNVTCPVRLFPFQTTRRYEVELDNPVISISFTGRPDPSNVTLDKYDADSWKGVSITFNISRKDPRDYDGNITISINEESSKVDGTYRLTASNTVQKGEPDLALFEIRKKSDSGAGMNIGLGVGVILLVVISVSIVVGLVHMRRQRNYISV